MLRGTTLGAVPKALPRGLALSVIVGAGLLAVALVAWHFRFREFYYDSAAQILGGDEVRAGHFLVNRGGQSGIGIANPPLFSWLMGAATALTHDPALITAATSALNLGGLALALWYFATWLPPVYAALAAILLAINPAAIFFTNLLWEGALLQPLAIIFQVLAAGVLFRTRPRNFFLLMLTADVAALCHQSGFMFFLPAIVLGLLRRRQIGGKTWLASLAVTILLFSPYAAFLASPEGLAQLQRYAGQEGGTSAAVQARLHIGMSSLEIFELLFAGPATSLPAALHAAAPGWGRAAFVFSLLIAAAFVAGWARFLAAVPRWRRLVRGENAGIGALPEPALVSGFVLTAIALQYLFAGGVLWFKHFLVAYPAYAVLAAWPFWRFWRLMVIRAVFIVAIVASLALTLALLRHIGRSGGTHAHGAIQVYGLSYDRLERIRADVRQLLPNGAAPELYAAGLWNAQIETVILRDLPRATGKGLPLLLLVADDPEQWDFSWAVRPIGDELARHRAAIGEALRMIPEDADVAANDAWREGGRHIAVFGVPFGSVDTIYQQLEKRGRVRRYRPETAASDATEFIALDTNDPRLPDNLSPSEVWRCVRSGSYRPIYIRDGVAVLRRGLGDGLGYGDLVAGFGQFPAAALFGEVGRRRPSAESQRGEIRVAVETHGAGFMLAGPWIFLESGPYRATFRFRSVPTPGSIPARFEVTGRRGAAIFAVEEVDLHGGDLNAWRKLTLGFNIPDGGTDDVEFRVFYPGRGRVEVESVTLTLATPGSG